MTTSLTTLVIFNDTDGFFPQASLIADANGDLFGTTNAGGAYGQGTVFEIVNTGTAAAPIYASTPTTLVSFNGTTIGAHPEGSLITDANGDLFGTTSAGVFEIVNTGTAAAPIYANTPTTIVTLYGIDGSYPTGSLITDANGDFFGTTSGGGINNFGTVFEIVNTGTAAAPIYASTPTTLVSFNGTNGAQPTGSLITDAKGDFFGTTNLGGTNNFGTVFEIVNTGTAAAPIYASTPTTLVSFNGTNGAQPYGSLTADANGDLFGTTAYGGTYGYGTVFEIVNTGTAAAPIYASTPSTLVSFNLTDGSGPTGSLIIDANGDLFGTTAYGGAYDRGTVFEIAKTASGYANTPTTVITFNGSNGGGPFGDLLADTKGDLFGTAAITAGAYGSVFEITNSGFVTTLIPTVVADSAHVSVAGTVTATAANGVLANDTDPIPNDTLVVSAVDGLASDVGQAIVGSYGTLTLNADGSYSYVANHSVPSKIIAQDIFTYTATDGDGGSATSTLTITVTQAGQTYIAGTPGQALTAGNNSVLLDGSLLQNETISAGNGMDAVIAGSNDTITLGNGRDVVQAGDGNTISLGNGIDTVTAGANSTITLGDGSDTVSAGNGSSITLGNGADTVIAGTNNIIKLGNGPDTVYAASGDTITVGSGHDTFVFGLSPGQTTAGMIGPATINHFSAANDVIEIASSLAGVWNTTSAGLSSHIQTVSGNAVITLDTSGDTITLVGVSASSLHASNFHFV